ncbi:MAG: hypothetical protein JNL44_14035 [Gemmatimonadetes bacterium]|nr:hypothetical protein [Gemmatimonadota bacterium]
MLPAVLAVMVALALLSTAALFDAVQEWRVATLAADRVVARAAALSALGAVSRPPALDLLCVSAPGSVQGAAAPVPGAGSARVSWRHLGSGAVRAEVTGLGVHGSRVRFLAFLAPDSADRTAALYRCPAASRLLPFGPRPIEGHPEG